MGFGIVECGERIKGEREIERVHFYHHHFDDTPRSAECICIWKWNGGEMVKVHRRCCTGMSTEILGDNAYANYLCPHTVDALL